VYVRARIQKNLSLLYSINVYCACVHTQSHTHTHTHNYTCIHTHTNTHTHTHTHAHTYTHTHTHTHTRLFIHSRAKAMKAYFLLFLDTLHSCTSGRAKALFVLLRYHLYPVAPSTFLQIPSRAKALKAFLVAGRIGAASSSSSSSSSSSPSPPALPPSRCVHHVRVSHKVLEVVHMHLTLCLHACYAYTPRTHTYLQCMYTHFQILKEFMHIVSMSEIILDQRRATCNTCSSSRFN
jgi:hypothetical protein